MRISDWSSDVCSSDLVEATPPDGSLRRKARRGRSPDLRRVVHAGDGTAGRVGGSRERGVPFDCNRRRARDRPAARHRARAGLAGKRFLEQRSEEHTSELQSLMRISYAVFCLTKKKTDTTITNR